MVINGCLLALPASGQTADHGSWGGPVSLFHITGGGGDAGREARHDHPAEPLALADVLNRPSYLFLRRQRAMLVVFDDQDG
jgi:hypothetical protein